MSNSLFKTLSGESDLVVDAATVNVSGTIVISSNAAVVDATGQTTLGLMGTSTMAAGTTNLQNVYVSPIVTAATINMTTGDLAVPSATITNPLTLNGVAYTLPAADGAAGEQLETDGVGNLSWNVASGSTTTVNPPAALQSIVSTAYNNTGSGVVQTIHASTGLTPSASVNTTTGQIKIDGDYVTNQAAIPQIHINPSGAGNSAQIKVGNNNTTTSSILGRGDMNQDIDGDLTLNVDILGTTGKLLKVQNNSADIFQVDEDGYIINQFGALTTLPNYNRQIFRTCIRLDGTVIPTGTNGIGNFFGAGGWTNNYLQPSGLPLPAFGGIPSTGGFINYCFVPTSAGIIRSCELFMPYSSTALTASIVETGLVPVGGITGANLVAAVATPLATFSQGGGVGANTAHTVTPSVSGLPTPGAFLAGTFIAMVITPTWNNVSNHDAVSPATQYYNFVTTIDFEY